jgi:AraC-like DNA-binding protein
MKTPTPPIHRWTTLEVAPERRLEFYSGVLSSAIDPMEVARAVPKPFDAQITAMPLGPLTLIHGVGHAHECVRDRHHVARSTERQFHLIVNRGAGWNLRHRAPVHLRRGDAVLLDSRLDHYLDFSHGFDIVHVRLPEAWLAQWLADPAELVGQPIPADVGWARALTAFVSQLEPESVAHEPLSAALIADQIGALFALHASEISGQNAHPALPQRQLRDLALECLAQRCTECSLSADDVAASLGVSTRALHRTLAACGQTFSGLLMETRVTLATRLLESPLMARLTVAEIGRRAGFSDPSHFARVFRRLAGTAPARARARLHPQTPPA